MLHTSHQFCGLCCLLFLCGSFKQKFHFIEGASLVPKAALKVVQNNYLNDVDFKRPGVVLIIFTNGQYRFYIRSAQGKQLSRRKLNSIEVNAVEIASRFVASCRRRQSQLLIDNLMQIMNLRW